MSVHLILGGVSSGKTAWGLRTALEAPSPKKTGRLIYLATAEAHDDEMAAKIARHQRERSNQGWQTLEEPHDLAGACGRFDADDTVLIDSVGMWMANVLMAEQCPDTAIRALIDALASCRVSLVLIGDEGGLGLVADTSLGRRFQRANGALNQALSGVACRVDLVVAGLVQRLK